MPDWNVWITETQGRKDITVFEEEPTVEIRGDTVRFIGSKGGRQQQLFVSLRAVSNVRLEEDDD